MLYTSLHSSRTDSFSCLLFYYVDDICMGTLATKEGSWMMRIGDRKDLLERDGWGSNTRQLIGWMIFQEPMVQVREERVGRVEMTVRILKGSEGYTN